MKKGYERIYIVLLAVLLAVPAVVFDGRTTYVRGADADDDPSGAVTLSLDEIYEATIDMDGADNVSGNADDDPVDFYMFTLSYEQTAYIALYVRESDYPTPAITLYLYGPDNASALITSDNSDGKSDSTHFYLSITQTLSAGNYYLKVESTDQRTIPYKIRVDYAEWPVVHTGDSVSNYAAYPYDLIDYYYLNITTISTVNISLDIGGSQDFDLYLCPDKDHLYDYLDSSTSSVAGQDELITYSFTSTGDYVIKVRAAYADTDINEGPYYLNITLVSNDEKPDLTVISIEPTTAMLNQSETFNITVKNIGYATTSGPVDVAVFLDTSQAPDTTLTTATALSPGQEAVVSYTHTFTQQGAHVITAVADNSSTVDELDENNNAMSQQITVVSADMAQDDTPAGANDIALNSTESNYLVQDMDLVDWWKFYVSIPGKIYIEVGWDISADIDVYLYEASDTSNYIARAYTTNNPETINYKLTSAGWYYVKVIPYNNNLQGTAIYNITVNFIPGEPNDSPAGAVTLVPNTVVNDEVSQQGDDEDWYVFNIAAAGTVDIQLLWASTSDTIKLYLYKPDTTTLVTSSVQTSTDWQSVTKYIDTPGNYYIKVIATTTSGNTSYTLKLNYTQGYTDYFYQGANSASINSTVQDYVCEVWDEYDWYRVTTPGPGRVYVNATYPSGDSLSLYLYDDPSGSSDDSSTSNPATTDITVYTSMDVYIKITTSKDHDVHYTLTIEYSNSVPDDTAAGAHLIAPNSTTNGTTDDDDKIDWYRVNITWQGTLDISLSWTATNKDMDLYLYDNPSASSLASATSSSANPETITHNVVPGDYYIKVKLYSSSSSPITYTLTLTFQPYIPGQGPDLVPAGITPQVAVEDSTYNFLVDITNQGNGNALGTFKVAVYYDSSTSPSTITIPGLSSQATTSVSFSHTFTSTGTHTVRVVVDKDNDIIEDDETNNEHTYNVQVNPPGTNVKPVPIISSPLNGSVFTTNDIIEFNGTASYDPDSLDTMSVIWRSDIDGVLGTTLMLSKKLSRGNHTIGLELTDSGGAFNFTEIHITVNLAPPNRNPVFTFLEPDGVKDVADVSYKIEWNWSDPDGDPCTVDIYYDADQNITNGMIQLVAGLDASMKEFVWDLTLVPNGNYFIFVRIKDGKGGMTAVYSAYSVEVHHNLPPSIVFLEPNGKDDKADTSFTVEWLATDYEDGKNLSISLYYFDPDAPMQKTAIFENGENTGSYVWDTTNLTAGIYGLYMTAQDSQGGFISLQCEDYITVEHNTPPPAIESAKPTTTHSLRPTITWEEVEDPDGDIVSYHLLVYNETDTLVDQILHRTTIVMPVSLSYGPDGTGSSYTVSITAIDYWGAESEPYVYTMSTYNHAPEQVKATIGPDEPRTDDDITVEVRLAEDPDGDDLMYRYEWYINGELVTSNLVDVFNFFPMTTYTLPSELTQKGDTIRCVITAWDGYLYSPAGEVNITIRNTAPTPVIAAPAHMKMFESSSVRFSADGTEDIDGDELTYTWTSDIDGVVGTGKEITATLSPGWHNITLVVSDGEASVEARVQIKIGAPDVVVKEISLLPANPKPGEDAMVWVTVVNNGDALAENIVVTLEIDGTPVGSKNISSLEPGDENKVSFQWTAAEGAHELYAYIESNPMEGDKHAGWKSEGVDISEESTGGVISGEASNTLTYVFLVVLIVLIAIVAFVLASYLKEKDKEPEKVVEVQEKVVYIPVRHGEMPPEEQADALPPTEEQESFPQTEEQPALEGEDIYTLPGQTLDMGTTDQEGLPPAQENEEDILSQLEVPEGEESTDVEEHLTEEDREIFDIPEEKDIVDKDEIDEIFEK